MQDSIFKSRPEVTSRRHRLIRTSLPIAALLIYFSSPPLKAIHEAREHESKKHNHESERQPGVQSRAQRHGVLCPPGWSSLADNKVENVTDERPHGEVEAGSRWDPAEATEEHWEVDLADNAASALACVQPEEDRSDGADWETPYENTVCCVWPEELAWPDNTPENAAVEVNSGEWACETVDSFRCTDSRDVLEHPIQNA